MSQEKTPEMPTNEKGSSSKDLKSPLDGAAARISFMEYKALHKLPTGVDMNHNLKGQVGAGAPRIATLPAGCQMLKLEGKSVFENLEHFATVLENGLDKTPPAHVPFSRVEMKKGDKIEIYEDV